MKEYSICVVGGWCGNRMVIVADHLRELLAAAGYSVKVKTYSVWENYSTPPEGDLILQLLPAYSQANTKSPILNIRPLLRDLDEPDVIAQIMEQVKTDFLSTRETA